MLGKREPEQSRSIVMAVGIALFALALPALAHSTQRLQVTEQRNAAEGFAVTLWMTQVDVLGKHCSTLGSKSDHRFREVLASWQKRNSPYVNAALEYMADIEDSIKASQGEAARQDFRNQRKAEFVESTPSSDYRDHWRFASNLGIRNFPPPAEVSWTSLDGVEHEAKVHIGDIFKDERVLYDVADSEIPDRSWGGEPGIILEVNDRTLSVYMKAFIATKTEQIPGNKNSDFRADVIPAWTHTY